MHDVLISYSSKDKLIADAVCNQLECNNIRVWIAPRDILAGESYPTAIIQGIRGCSIIVLLFTANSNGSQWVPREVERGVSYGKIIIPFKIEEVIPIQSDLELCTSTQHWLDAMTPPLEAHIAELVLIINKLVGRGPGNVSSQIKQTYSALSPMGQFYQLAKRWQQYDHAYYVLESLNAEQKSFLRNTPKHIEIEDENVILFMLTACLHYGGDWIYWSKKIKEPEILAQYLIKVLEINYIRPRYSSLYLMQAIDSSLLLNCLEKSGITKNSGLLQLIEKQVFTKNFYAYLEKLSCSADPEFSKRAKSVLMEINRYSTDYNTINIFPES